MSEETIIWKELAAKAKRERDCAVAELADAQERLECDRAILGARTEAMNKAHRDLDTATQRLSEARELLREVGGIIDEFDGADDSTDELRIIHKLGAWAERALSPVIPQEPK